MYDPVTCEGFRRRLYHFQADALPEAERQVHQDHLDACPACARRLTVEEVFLRSVRARLKREPAPEHLRRRVQAALRRESPRAGRTLWMRGPWLAAAAASLLLALVLLPNFIGPASSVEREVIVVDLDCDRAGRSLAAQRGCDNPLHLNALKLDDGNYWTLSLGGAESRRLVLEPDMRGHRLHVVGGLYPAIRTFRLDSFEDLGLVSLQTAWRPGPAESVRPSAGS